MRQYLEQLGSLLMDLDNRMTSGSKASSSGSSSGGAGVFPLESREKARGFLIQALRLDTNNFKNNQAAEQILGVVAGSKNPHHIQRKVVMRAFMKVRGRTWLFSPLLSMYTLSPAWSWGGAFKK